jgi:beta-lactamase regulating signal transducer with metallopeptidase domain/protocatechuate 3,4-dioxygenase beta subunit
MTAAGILYILDSAGFNVMRFFLSILWQSSIIIAVTLILSWILRKERSSLRHAILISVIIVVPLIPLLTVIVSSMGTPQTPIPVMPKYDHDAHDTLLNTDDQNDRNELNISNNQEYSQPPLNFREGDGPPQLFTIPQQEPNEIRKPINIFDYPWVLALVLYTAGAIFFMMMLLLGRMKIKHWLMESTVITDSTILDVFRMAAEKLGLKRDFVVVRNDLIDTPLTTGTFHPVVMLSKEFSSQIDNSEIYKIALHELAHIKRKDTLSLNLVLIVRAIFFFHPLIWFASRYVSLLAENSCDYVVIESNKEPLHYAKMLAGIAENLSGLSLKNDLAIGMFCSKSAFLRRVETILSNQSGPIRKVSRAALATIVASVVMTIVLALHVPLEEMREMVTVSGMVVHDGRAVPGTNIYYSRLNVYSFRQNIVEHGSTTRKDGSFEFKIHASELPVHIVAFNLDYAINWIPLTDENNLNGIRLELGLSDMLSGYVRTDEDIPIEGAEISVSGIVRDNDFNGRISNSKLVGVMSTTDANGFFSLNNLPKNSRVSLQLLAKGYEKGATSENSNVLRDIEISVRPEGRIAGRVIYDKTGKPASGLMVRYKNKITLSRCEGVVTTDKRGRFTLSNLMPGTYFVHVLADNNVKEWTSKYVDNISVISGETKDDIELRLIKGGIITGKVIGEDTGRPIPGQTVHAFGPDRMLNTPFGSDVTDKNGEYQIRMFPGKTEVKVFPSTEYNNQIPKTTVDVVEGGRVTHVDFTYKRGISIKGNIVVPDGHPLGGVTISNAGFLGNMDWKGTVHTKHDGTFTLNGVIPGEEIELKAIIEEEKLRGFVQQKMYPGDEIEIRLEKYDTAIIEGKVINEMGNQVQGITMELLSQFHYGGGAVGINSATTDSLGFYRMDDLIIGDKYTLLTYTPGYTQVQIKMNDLNPGLNTIADMIVRRADRWIEGVVRDSDSEPLSGARVAINGPPSGYKMDVTDETGYYRLENLANVIENSVHVSHKDYGSYRFRSVKTNKESDFTLIVPKYHLSGSVVDSDGNPVPELTIRIEPSSDESGKSYMGVQTDMNGKFRFDDLLDPEINLRLSNGKEYLKVVDVETNRDNVKFVF